MNRKFGKSARAGVVLVVLAVLAAGVFTAASAGSTRAVRGFDGSTITVASFGIKAQFPGVPIGVQARLKRFNDTQELKGVKIKWAEFADDKQEQATALSEARRLATEVGTFAIVGDVSQFNPKDYFTQQHIPYFGWGFDDTYCSHNQTTSLWGFSYTGCIVASDPAQVGDAARASYQYVSQKTGKKHPTVVLFSNDTNSGKSSVKFSATAAEGAGFKVIGRNNQMPTPPISDYTPYVQAVLKGDNGQTPDLILCNLATDCIPMWDKIKNSGYQGTFQSGLYSNVLTKAMAGSVATALFVNPLENTPGMDQLKKDVDAFQPGQSANVDSGMIAGYGSADMFIQALKTAAKKGKSNITPEAVQKAAANQTWQIKGLAGPTTYPQSTVYAYPYCTSLFQSDGAQWTTAVPFQCSTKRFKPNPKFG